MEFILKELRKNYPQLNALNISVKTGEAGKFKVEKSGNSVEIIVGDKSLLSLAISFILEEKGDLVIENGIAFKNLGVMIDCSRNAVLSVSGLKTLIRHLALMGYNYIELYTEDTYEIEGEPYFGYMRGRYTGEEIREIDEYAKGFNVEVIPCIQTLAHLNAIFRWGEYDAIRDCDDILLVEDERTYAFIDKMFNSISKNFSSRKVHIGMDEAHMLGRGRYYDKNGDSNKHEILYKHLLKVLEIADKYGFKAQMWSDMFFRLAFKGEYYECEKKLPEEVKKLVPQNVTLVYWDYYHEQKDFYAKMIKRHKELTEDVSFAGGAWKWSGFTPHNEISFKTTLPGIQVSKKVGVEDVLITSWGDNGGECPIFAVYPMLYKAGQEALLKRGGGLARFKWITKLSYQDFMQIENLNYIDDAKTQSNATKYMLYNDVMQGLFDKHVIEGENAKYFGEYAKKLKAISKKESEFKVMFKAYSSLAKLLEEKCDAGIKLKNAYDNKDKDGLEIIANKTLPSIIKKLDEFIAVYKELWLSFNKPFGFEVQDIRLGGLRQRLVYAISMIKDYLSGKLEKLEELDIERLEIEKGKKILMYNAWGKNATTGVL